MKTNCRFLIRAFRVSSSAICAIATWHLGELATSAQTGDYLYNGSKQTITLNPGLYDITAYGAQGGGYYTGPDTYQYYYGGIGAEMEGEFYFSNATTLTLLVGGAGQGAATYAGGGGGGGSFVVAGSTPLVVAGGGGGIGDPFSYYDSAGGSGLTGENGGNGDSGVDGAGGSGGSDGSGGIADTNSAGSGGGGYSGNGGTGGTETYGGIGTGGSSYLTGGGGGKGYYENGNAGQGGYGGGGGGDGGGGGGGGYSGGGGGAQLAGGGGGGSCIDSSAIADLTEVSAVASPDDSPNGEIIITAAQPPLCISESANTVSVFWPAVPGWSIQQNTNLANPSGWTPSSGVNTSNGTNYLNITVSAGSLFFRLSN